MTELPEPLTPADCNLRGLPFMPLHTDRLLDSDMMALSTGEEFKTALRLWCKSWNQEPAASLPDDDRILAHLAGKELAGWRKVKGMALRGWIKCSDGRLYHPVIAEEAIKAMAKRELHQEKKEGDSDRKREEREDRRLLFGALRDIGVILPAKGTSTSHLRKVAASQGMQIIVTEGHKVVTVTPQGSHNESHGGVTAKTGTGTGTYIKEGAAAAPPAPVRTHACEAGDDPPPSHPSPDEAQARVTQIAVILRRGGACQRTTMPNNRAILTMAEKGYADVIILQALQTGLQRRRDAGSRQPVTAAYLLPIIEELQTGPPARAGGRYAEDIRQMREMSAWADQQILEQQGATRPPAELDMGASDAPRND